MTQVPWWWWWWYRDGVGVLKVGVAWKTYQAWPHNYASSSPPSLTLSPSTPSLPTTFFFPALTTLMGLSVGETQGKLNEIIQLLQSPMSDASMLDFFTYSSRAIFSDIPPFYLIYLFYLSASYLLIVLLIYLLTCLPANPTDSPGYFLPYLLPTYPPTYHLHTHPPTPHI